MSKYITVSAKVRRELLDEARKLNINVSELIRNALENEVRRRKLLLLEEKLKNQKSILDKINIDDIVKIIREDRESR
ncbi:MAG: type II toxin-antitoxin system CcdA family antitoxin [Candidatus Verstraetearchaeota archaeon]|jgi:post-segregation antitoxin (ccd killing protein)|nr:type II toxin-antitoxin system CcdA family antitoxin [Candidatus Verstraetearchaeota archaeon]